jgi:hypothetical protein
MSGMKPGDGKGKEKSGSIGDLHSMIQILKK